MDVAKETTIIIQQSILNTMKNNFVYFILGVFAAISIAATSNQGFTIIQPKKPLYTIVESYNSNQHAKNLIVAHIKNGYQVQNITLAPSTYGGYGLIVMVKY